MLTLNTNIREINRVGSTTAQRLRKLGVETVADLLFYFPFRYDDFRDTCPIDRLQPGQSVTVQGTVEMIQNKKSPRKKINITEALVSDNSGFLKVVWFNQPFLTKNIKPGDRLSLAGKTEDQYGQVTLVSPIYENADSDSIHTQGLVPNYHLTANLTQKQVRFLVKQVIHLARELDDWLPENIRQKHSLMPIQQAVAEIHFPADWEKLEKAKQRMAFNELFALQLESLWIKKELKSSRSDKIVFREKQTRDFVSGLPFTLTDAQKKAAWEILKDLEKEEPMARLLEGDVGSGKTVVALLAMLNTALNNKQSVLMVPTEILAGQHFRSLNKLLGGQPVKTALITRSEKRVYDCARDSEKELTKKEAAQVLARNEAQIVIGTHALLQEDVEFHDLVLAVIDEQHRFGVEQRKKLVKKSGTGQKDFLPHLLSMTATPIPRSLALTLYGELDLSIIRQMPQGRKPVLTRVVPEGKRKQAYDFIRDKLNKGGQAFVVCPLIDMSDKLGVKSVKEEFKKLNEKIFSELPVAMLHGRLKTEEKEEIMRSFQSGKTKVLVSTSVVEVGVDVPNANIMLIEGSDRFGLAQLHQFRGRIGRGEQQAFCFLFTDSDSDKTLERLKALEKTNDGFELAKTDLEIRGPGQFFGTEQKGFPEMRVATLWDQELIQTAQNEAQTLLDTDPDLTEHPRLRELAQGRAENIHLE